MKLSTDTALVILGLGAFLLLQASWASGAEPFPSNVDEPQKYWAYVGTYTGGPGKSQGIYRFDFDAITGQLTGRALAAETKNPSFLAIHPSRRFLYAVGELDNFQGKTSGAVSAFSIDPKTGDLTLLNQQPSGGAGPCHLVVDKAGKHVLAANYSGGSVCVLPIAGDGKLGTASAFRQHHGAGINKQRQEGPHAHSVNLDAANRFAVVADLGLDKVMIYKYDAGKGTLTPNSPPATDIEPGSGPRHFAFHPDGHHAYAINELTSTVTAMDYDADKGTLKPMQTVSTLPQGFAGDTTCAEVQVHPSGKFLYGSNRGHNSIAIFTVDEKTGRLAPAGHQTQDIKIPRNFVIDPTGNFCLVANQDGNSIVVFRVDPKTGQLTPTGQKVEVPMPVCIKVMQIGK
ncbi:MAG TPA: lactonase family protein [Gemmataceae bacterium]|jgi:6-phosphogluconolactonase|nr:lactonase family protein [Gemmataceae bacterium]